MTTTLGTLLTAIVTPFDDELKVDEDAFVALLHHVIDSGSDGVVVCGTTGEAATLTNEEHLRLVEIACAERPEGVTILGSTGSNDTAQACAMTERVTELGVDGVLSVTPYYNRPNRRGLVRHYTEIAQATDKPVVLYNVPSRTAIDVPNDLLAELAQIERVDYVKQANDDNLALIDGLGVYSGNNETFARALDMGGVGGIVVASHVAGPQMRRMIDEPENRAELDAALKDLFAALSVTTNPIPVKAALNLLGHRVGGPRLPLVEADEAETAVVRNALIAAGFLES
ncbi:MULTISPECIES: 4-hydroxy-tetrahydrodipicolinate synthase [unclassified Saccharopolyspora]|uniref:4-hydroxy-tetrahydrodipicolinate synthase n=1 Tax=unclassified Saccharopolyspora TaxID=2646250 RepID=UPI001CD2777B|nr:MULTISPECIES: 4-hydroxy-tetrahydrodipicolinate synthase [unclassified Saccharopolyspora]MCA1184830.1 4-hydroxy-tetrahydrodipicolinate synthase [Saccharopolyspora sp. 6T]MCA1190555.1 4-hydroxy-tetrahydrodipicolinate synthase [Saccharopolyspora sp. 6V]MCA1226424.1 4-hydroxy-tetrahydrodipicolinate synthase [Saccharopolyspora sp. 6M]MCA1280869.1 4-hydroxy-tetrahydrodipicolinate synthase [Saccharopolyspora sp. 7B]